MRKRKEQNNEREKKRREQCVCEGKKKKKTELCARKKRTPRVRQESNRMGECKVKEKAKNTRKKVYTRKDSNQTKK